MWCVVSVFFFLMLRLPPIFTRTYTLFPYSTLFRSGRSLHPPLPARSPCGATRRRRLSDRGAAAAVLPRRGDGGVERGGDHPALDALAALWRHRRHRRELGRDGGVDGLRRARQPRP